MSKVKYTVLTNFAHFKAGQVIELDKVCPSAAQPHVKLHVEIEGSKDSVEVDSEALSVLGELYTIVTGDKAGKKQAKTLKEGVEKAIESFKLNYDELSSKLSESEAKVTELEATKAPTEESIPGEAE